MGTRPIPLLFLLMNIGCSKASPAPKTQVTGRAKPSVEAPSIRAESSPQVEAPKLEPPQDLTPLRLHAFASDGNLHAFRLRETSKVWAIAPGCPSAHITPILKQDEAELTRVGEPQTLELPAGVYSLSFSAPDPSKDSINGQCTAFLQTCTLGASPCPKEAAGFGVLPFDLEPPVIESLGDLNGDLLEDYAVTFSASPSQVGVRVVAQGTSPDCFRTVFDGIGQVVIAKASQKGWRRLNFVELLELAPNAPKRLIDTYGSAWSVTWALDYDRTVGAYCRSPVPVRCEVPDGVQRALGAPGVNPRATLIPQGLCQRTYLALTDAAAPSANRTGLAEKAPREEEQRRAIAQVYALPEVKEACRDSACGHLVEASPEEGCTPDESDRRHCAWSISIRRVQGAKTEFPHLTPLFGFYVTQEGALYVEPIQTGEVVSLEQWRCLLRHGFGSSRCGPN